MKSLPFIDNFYGKDARRLPAKVPPEWPPTRLRFCQPQLADFVRQTLQWHPPGTIDGCIRQPTLARELARPLRDCSGRTGEKTGWAPLPKAPWITKSWNTSRSVRPGSSGTQSVDEASSSRTKESVGKKASFK